MKTEKISVGKVSDFIEDTMTPFEIADRSVLVVLQDGKFYALEDKCTHDNGILHDGELIDGAVKCERHGAKFNLKTGAGTMPAVKKLRLYQIEIDADEVFVVYQEV